MVIHRPTRDTRGCRDIFQGDRGEAAGCEGLTRRRQHGSSRPGGVLGRSACHKTFLYVHGVCILAFTNTLYVRRVAMRSEERRVGKEWRDGRGREQKKRER